MPSGVGLELVAVAGLILLLAAGVVVGRLRSSQPAPAEEPARPAPETLGAAVRQWLGTGKPVEDDWKRLEEALIAAEAGPRAASEIVTRVRERLEPGDDPERLLGEEMAGMFEGDPALLLEGSPAVVVIVGAQRSGKTTTMGKLAHRLVDQGRLVAVTTSDTFQAGAVSRLAEWAERAGADLLAWEGGADATTHAARAAKARGHDVLLVETPGRLPPRRPLKEALGEVIRPLQESGGVAEILLVADATAGRDGLDRSRELIDAVEVTGIAIAKLDGSANRGVVLAIREELGIPVKLLGEGEGIGDLRAFDPRAFASGLLRD